jgi:hypothetical protein
MLCGERLHIIEGILSVSRGIVGYDRNRADANLARRLGLRYNPINARLHIRTVIADKNDERAVRATHVGKRIAFAVHTFELEVARLLAEVANSCFGHAITNSPLWLLQCRILSVSAKRCRLSELLRQ